MHHAPAVSYPVGRCFAVGVAAAAAGGVGLLATLAWAARGDGAVLRYFAALGALALALWALRQWQRTAEGILSWDGQAWRWSCRQDAPGQLTVSLDLQAMLLLRWQAVGASAHWLLLERSRSPQRWDDLRRAVYSRATPDALPGSEPPAANP